MIQTSAFMDELFDVFYNKNQQFSEEMLKLYKKINDECKGEQEIALLYVVEAYSQIYSGKLHEALLTADKICANQQYDPQMIYNIRKIYSTIYSQINTLMNTDITNKEIGPVFDELLSRGYMGLTAQVLAANHFEAVGLIDRAVQIRDRIEKLFPNYLKNL